MGTGINVKIQRNFESIIIDDIKYILKTDPIHHPVAYIDGELFEHSEYYLSMSFRRRLLTLSIRSSNIEFIYEIEDLYEYL